VPYGPRFAKILLHDRRFDAEGSVKPDYILNQDPYQHSRIAVGGRNFGVGSSRETAVLGFCGFGIRSIIAPSFGDIFFNNCFKNAVLPVQLQEESVNILLQQLYAERGAELTVDLPGQVVIDPDGNAYHFEIEALRKHRLLKGLDELSHTQEYRQNISDFEVKYRAIFSWM
jgi:3-isopropylmalate/(R)-2-methylmalate dehydratase small subunit